MIPTQEIDEVPAAFDDTYDNDENPTPILIVKDVLCKISEDNPCIPENPNDNLHYFGDLYDGDYVRYGTDEFYAIAHINIVNCDMAFGKIVEVWKFNAETNEYIDVELPELRDLGHGFTTRSVTFSMS